MRKRIEQLELIELLRKRLFYLSATFIGIAELIDILVIEHSRYNTYINIGIAAIMAITIAVYLLKQINIPTANSIVVFVILVDVIASPFLRLDHTELSSFFLRASLVVFAIIPYASFTIGKWHGAAIGIIYYINYIVVLLLSKNNFLLDTFAVITFVTVAFSLGIYILTSRLFAALYIQKDLIKSEQNHNKLLTEERNKLEKVNESKQRLFSIISHDLKNPFNTILGFVQLIEDDINNREYEDLKRHQVFLKQSTEKAYFLLQNLLDWAQTEQNTADFNPTRFSFNDLVAQVYELVCFELGRKKIVYYNRIDGSQMVTADRNMLFSILRNLFTNAIKFTPKNGSIEISSKKGNDSFEFRISDSGIGLAETEAERLFSGNHVPSRKGTDNESGTGLGLKICKDFIDFHKGQIWVQKNPDKGLSVYFRIPQQ